MVHVPATISSVKEEGLDRGKENKLREKGRESVWQECFEFVWRRGTGMRQEPALSDVNGLFPGQYASRVCVFQAQTVVLSNHDLHIKVEVCDDRDEGSCQNKIITIPPLRCFHSLSSLFLFSYMFRHDELSSKIHP